jgi:hypothetical protein
VTHDSDACQGPSVQMFWITPRDGRPAEGAASRRPGRVPFPSLGNSRTVTSITGSPTGTPSRDLPSRRSLVIHGFSGPCRLTAFPPVRAASLAPHKLSRYDLAYAMTSWHTP